MTARRLYIAGIYAAIIFVAGGFCVLTPPEGMSSRVALLALLIATLGGVPAVEYFVNRSDRPIPFMPGVGIFYAIVFGITMFSRSVADFEDPLWNEQTQADALGLVSAGVGTMLLVFYFSRDFVFRRVRTIRFSRGASDLRRFHIVAWVLVVTYLLAVIFDWNHKVPTMGNYFSNSGGLVGIGLTFFLWTRGILSVFEKTILIVVIAPAVLMAAFTSGLLSAVLLLTVFFGLLVYRLTRRVPWVLVTMGGLFIVIFTPIKNEYRVANVYMQQQQASHLEKAELFSNLALDYLRDNSPSDLLASSWDKIAVRLCNSLVFAQVVGSTPSVVPYWEGETYLHLFYKPVPRVFWERKPAETVGNDFGRRYGILASGDDETSVNLPWIVEMYANFGGGFVLGGMALIGCFFGWLDRKFNGRSMNDVEFVFALSLLVPLIYQESNFSLTFGGFLFSGVTTFFLLSFISRIKRSTNVSLVGNA